MKLSALGATVVVSTGDNGVSFQPYCSTCSSSSGKPSYWSGASWSGKGYFPQFPATSPYVTAVGGTMGLNTGGEEIACQSQLLVVNVTEMGWFRGTSLRVQLNNML